MNLHILPACGAVRGSEGSEGQGLNVHIEQLPLAFAYLPSSSTLNLSKNSSLHETQTYRNPPKMTKEQLLALAHPDPGLEEVPAYNSFHHSPN